MTSDTAHVSQQQIVCTFTELKKRYFIISNKNIFKKMLAHATVVNTTNWFLKKELHFSIQRIDDFFVFKHFFLVNIYHPI